MRVDLAMRKLVVVLAAVVLGAGCSHIPGLGKAQASPAASSSAAAALDSPIPTPAGFPTDVPVYPGARLTAGASFTSTGQVAWGMEWETTDSASSVWSFYRKEFATGDWTLSVTSGENGLSVANVARRSSTSVKGVLAVYSDTAVTMVTLSLSAPG